MTLSTSRAVIVQPGGGFDAVAFRERPVPEAFRHQESNRHFGEICIEI